MMAYAFAAADDAGRRSDTLELDPDLLLIQDKKDPPKKDPPKKDPKGKDVPPKKEEPDVLAQATNTGGEAPESSFTRMMGDWVGALYATQRIQVPAIKVNTVFPTGSRTQITRGVGQNGEPVLLRNTVTFPLPPGTTVTQTTETVTAQVPILSRGSLKIGENERPKPEDRVFITGNRFQGVPGPIFPQPLPTTSLNNGVPTTTQTFIPSQGQDTYVNRGVIGFEATFLDGLGSFGMRLPYLQQQGDGTLTDGDFGDLTFVLKVLAYSFGDSGISGGVVVTAATGPAIETIQGPIRSTLIQPWVGFFLSEGPFFAMGFSSVAFPTESLDTIIAFNDLGVGFMAYQDGAAYIAPMFEAHLTTPLNNRSDTAVLSVPDLLVLTAGVQFGYGPASITFGAALPVTGPRPYDYEGFVQINFRY
jgi:hypothetical protein